MKLYTNALEMDKEFSKILLQMNEPLDRISITIAKNFSKQLTLEAKEIGISRALYIRTILMGYLEASGEL
jgi:hypothetical protein